MLKIPLNKYTFLHIYILLAFNVFVIPASSFAQAGMQDKPWSWIYTASMDSLEKYVRAKEKQGNKDTTLFAIYDDMTSRYNMIGNIDKSIEYAIKMQNFALSVGDRISFYYAKTVEAMLKAGNGTHLNAIDANRVHINYLLNHKSESDILGTIRNLNLATSFRNIAQLYAILRIDSCLYYYDKAIAVITPEDYKQDLYNCISNEVVVQRGRAMWYLDSLPQRSLSYLIDAKNKLINYKTMLEGKRNLTEFEKTDIGGKLFVINTYTAKALEQLQDVTKLEAIVKEMENGVQSSAQNVFVLEHRARLFFLQKKYDAAIKNILEAFEIVDKKGDYKSIASYGLLLSQLYNVKGEIATANKYLEKSKKADEVLRVFTANRALNADLYKRDKEALAIDLKTQNLKFYVVVLLLILAGVILWFMIRRKKLSEKLHQQKLKESELQHALRELEIKFESQMQERKRIAKELHDGLGSSLTGAKMAAESIAVENKDAEPLVSMLTSISKEMRDISHDLAPPDFENSSLPKLLEDMINALNHNHIEKKIDLIIDTETTGMSLTNFEKKSLYRIAQELINNAFKHADSRYIGVILSQLGDGLLLSIEDEGKGFDKENETRGMGILSCIERSKEINAIFSIESIIGKGTVAQVLLPQYSKQNEN